MAAQVDDWKPRALRFNSKACAEVLLTLERSAPGITVHDSLMSQLRELVEGREPGMSLSPEEIGQRIDRHLGATHIDDYGNWFFYPWTRKLVRVLPEPEFSEVRLSRNRNKITPFEQNTLGGLRIGIAGLSVGQATAVTLAMEGIGRRFVLADFDTLSLSNMNRLRAALHDIGVNKALLTARALSEINPYLEVEVLPEGLHETNVDAFMSSPHKLDLLIEECDDMHMKFLLREKARQLSIAVLMETNDRGMLDVERFDREPERPLFHGRAGQWCARRLRDAADSQKLAVAMAIVGAETVSPRMAASAVEIGATLKSWPQLASGVSLGAAIVTDAARRIALGEMQSSGRYYVDLERIVCDPSPIAANGGATRNHHAVSSHGKHATTTVPYLQSRIALDEKVRRIVQSAGRAPSGGNSQPWQFVWNGEVLRMTHNLLRGTTLLDFKHRASHLAFGAATENAVLAAADLGLRAEIRPYPIRADDTLVAEFRFVPDNAIARDPLSTQIERRTTNRRLGDPTPLPRDVVRQLVASAQSSSVELRLIEDRDLMQRLACILGKGDRLRFLSKTMHRELMGEIRWTMQEVEESRDGIDLRTLELAPGDLAALKLTAHWRVMEMVGAVGGGSNLEKFALKAASGSSAFGLLTVRGDDPRSYFEGGRVMQRLWLTATALDLGFQPMAALPYLFMRAHEGGTGLSAHETATLLDLRAPYRRLLEIPEGQQELLLFRLAIVAPPELRALRRNVEDILTITAAETGDIAWHSTLA